MAFTQKIFSSYQPYSDGNTRIGELYRIWYDSNTNTLRIQLDDTPGGTIIGGGEGGGTAQGLTFVGDDSTGTRVSDGETLKVTGTGGITTAVSGDTLTITGPNLSSYLTNSTLRVVGDDSTGVILNNGETLKIAGTSGITTAVSGDTLTITGPNLGSYLTAEADTLDSVTDRGNTTTNNISVNSVNIPVGSVISSAEQIIANISNENLDSVLEHGNDRSSLTPPDYGLSNGLGTGPYAVLQLKSTPAIALQVDDVVAGAGIPVGSKILYVGTGSYNKIIITDLNFDPDLPLPVSDTVLTFARAITNAGLSIVTQANTDITLNAGAGGHIINHSDIIPYSTDTWSLGTPSHRFKQLWLGAGTIYIKDETLGTDTAIGARDGLVYLQGGVGLKVGEFTLIDNQIKIGDATRNMIVGSLGATGNITFNRAINVQTSSSFSTFSVSREGRVEITVPNIPSLDRGAVLINGSTNGTVQPVVSAGGMLHLSGNDNRPSIITNDSFGTGVFPLYVGRQARGTSNSPTATKNLDVLTSFNASGYTGSAYGPNTTSLSAVQFQAAEDFSNSAVGTRINFLVVPTGSVTRVTGVSVDSTGIVFTNNSSSGITFFDNTRQTTAAQPYTFNVAADDSTSRTINNGETVKFIGSSGITTASDSEGNITITGPNLSSYLTNSTITVVGDDSTGVTLNNGETLKIAGASNISTAVSGDTLTITGPNLTNYTQKTDKAITIVGDDSTGTDVTIGETFKIAGAGTVTTAVSGDTLTISGSAYSLPTASTTVLGGVKVDGTTITINGSGVITANYPDALSELTDTNVAGASNNQVLTYNTATSKWIPTTVNGVDTLPTGIAYYGSFYDTSAEQTATSQTTAYVVAIGQTAEANGVSIVSGNRITFAYAGTYEIEFSLQFHNVETDASDVNVWFRKNGSDIADSNSRFTIPSKQNNNGYLIAITPFIVTVTAGQYVQIVWSCDDNTTTKIETLAPGTTPTVPRTPGVIVLVNPVTSLITPTTVESLTVTGATSTGSLTFPDATVQTTAWTGSSPTLTTARNINGVSFNGSADITVTAAAGTLTGNTLASGVTASSLTSVGTLTNLSVTNTITGSVSGSAATLTTARNINGVSFNGSAAINIPTLTDGTNSIKITAVPSALTGAAGDVVGSVAFDSTYIYYCFQAFTGTSYSLPIVSSGGLIQVVVDAGSSALRIAIVAAFAATPAGWSYGGAPVTNITGSNQIINITMSSGYSGLGNGISYTLIQPPATANWKTTPWGAITSAAAGSLTGNTLASGVTASSLTSFGATPAMTSPAITNSLTTPSTIFDLINTTATTVNFAGAATTLSVGAGTGTTTINNNLSMASGKTIGTTATVTSNHTTAFSAGDSAISNVALSVPRDAAIRDRTNGASVIYFDVSNGGTTNGQFQFRSSSAFTNVLTMSPTGFNVNLDATVTARTPSVARTAFNAAMGTELTVDEMRFRITNSGLAGIFPQVIGNTSARNLAWTVVAARSGSAVTQAGSTGTIVANNAWTSLYTLGGMDSAGDTFTATLQDKALSRIYRVTFMRSDNGADIGYNIIAERLL